MWRLAPLRGPDTPAVGSMVPRWRAGCGLMPLVHEIGVGISCPQATAGVAVDQRRVGGGLHDCPDVVARFDVEFALIAVADGVADDEFACRRNIDAKAVECDIFAFNAVLAVLDPDAGHTGSAVTATLIANDGAVGAAHNSL